MPIMKTFTSFITLLTSAIFAVTTNGTVVPHGSTRGLFIRQAGYQTTNENKYAPIHSMENLSPKNPNAIRKKIRFGPWNVPGSKQPSVGPISDEIDKFGAIAIDDKIESLCGDCTILNGIGVPEFINGTAITAVGGSIYNHHVFLLDRSKMVSSHICPGDANAVEKLPSTVIVSQTDREITTYTSPDGKLKTGFVLKSTDRLELLSELMNYNLENIPVTVAFDFEYLPGKPEGYLHSQSVMFSAAPCDHTSFNVPEKQYTIKSGKWKAPVDLTLINARGHQHDGGVGMNVFVNDKKVCSTIPTYTKMESRGSNETVHYTIREMSLCELQIQIKKDDIVTIESNYDVEKYPQRISNTGHMETVAAMLSAVLGLPPDFDVATL